MRRERGLLTVLTPIIPGHEAALTADLRTLAATVSPPFEAVGGVHLARWVVVGQVPSTWPGLPRVRRPLRMRYLLFTAMVDGSPEAFLARMRTTMGAAADSVWRHCVGYPTSGSEQFDRYLLDNSLPIRQRFEAHSATVPAIRAALGLREQHIRLAVQTQGAGANPLPKFLAMFPIPPSP